MGHSIEVEPWGGGTEIVNHSDIPAGIVWNNLSEDDRSFVANLMQWSTSQRLPHEASRRGGLYERDRFLTPLTTFDQIRVARAALDDDVVGGALDVTEAHALAKVSIFADDEDDEDIWNQWAGDVDLDSRLREAWALLYTDSQYVAATWWDTRSYKVRGETDKGNARRTSYRDLEVPTEITFFDTTKVTPVGELMFGRESLAYIASRDEAATFDRIISGQVRGPRALPPGYTPGARPAAATVAELDDDEIVGRLIVGRYRPDTAEAQRMRADGVSQLDNLFLLDSRYVWRHTLTRPTFERFSRVRLKSVFPLLDLKHQLRQADRAPLIGAANFIILITKGSDKLPAQGAEIAELAASQATIASLPVIVGDHRLKVEIISPKLDVTLKRDRWDVLDARIFARCFGTLVPTGSDQDDPIKLGKIIGRSLESRRRMDRRAWEANVFDPMRVANERGDRFRSRAKLRYHPARIIFDFDAALANFLLDLRESNEVSRHTVLGLADLSQAEEAALREREADTYDEIFKTQVPHSNPNPALPEDNGRAAQRRAGRRGGGNRNGGGAAPGTGQGQAPSNPRKLSDMSRPELIDLARNYEIVGRSRMNVPELRDALEAVIEED